MEWKSFTVDPFMRYMCFSIDVTQCLQNVLFCGRVQFESYQQWHQVAIRGDKSYVNKVSATSVPFRIEVLQALFFTILKVKKKFQYISICKLMKLCHSKL